jgi:hypothetical protein
MDMIDFFHVEIRNPEAVTSGFYAHRGARRIVWKRTAVRYIETSGYEIAIGVYDGIIILRKHKENTSFM